LCGALMGEVLGGVGARREGGETVVVQKSGGTAVCKKREAGGGHGECVAEEVWCENRLHALNTLRKTKRQKAQKKKKKKNHKERHTYIKKRSERLTEEWEFGE